MKYGLAEMLQMVAEAPKEQRAGKLRDYAMKNQALVLALRLTLDPRFQFDFEPGWQPEYTPAIDLDLESVLHFSVRKMDKFLKGGPYPNLDPERRKLLFVQLLESVAPADAELLILMKDKKLPYKLTRKLVLEAMPGLVQEEKVDAGAEGNVQSDA